MTLATSYVLALPNHCPKCGAAQGTYCVTRGGNRRTAPHGARLALARGEPLVTITADAPVVTATALPGDRVAVTLSIGNVSIRGGR